MEYVELLNCMRCGMCLPHCPTYKETFLETASPRGRVALVRKIQDGDLEVNERTLEFLTLCLDCQACATACPCGVNAGELVAEFKCEEKEKGGLSFMEELILRKLVPHPDRLESAMLPLRLYQKTGLQRLVRTLGILKMFPPALERMEGLLPPLPARPLRKSLQEVTPAVGEEKGTVGFFLGCVMSLIFSEASHATVRLLSTLGYKVITPKSQKCCGAPNMLGSDLEGVRRMALFNVELFGSHDLDFIVTDCGGCGAELKKYGRHLPGDKSSAEFSAKVRDISELLALHADELKEKLKPLPRKVTWHDACHIAHCQGIRQQPRALLALIPQLEVSEMNDPDTCCGSGGTYNIAQPEMSDRILKRKVDSILATGADYLVTANPGCLLQLKKALSETTPKVKVVHLTELLSESLVA